MGAIWRFLLNPKNRTVLSWLGGGVVVVVVGFWTAFTFLFPPNPGTASGKPAVQVGDCSVGAGRDASGNTVNCTKP